MFEAFFHVLVVCFEFSVAFVILWMDYLKLLFA